MLYETMLNRVLFCFTTELPRGFNMLADIVNSLRMSKSIC